jgi:hypothetical protein
MKNTKFYNVSENLSNVLISAAYGDVSFLKQLRLRLIRKINPLADKIYQEHKKIADEIKTTGKNTCPPQIVDSVFSRLEITSEPKHNFREDLYSIFMFKPVYTYAVVLLIIGGLLFSIFQDTPKVKYTNAEIQLADRQAKETLLLVSAIFNKTSSTLTNDILPEQVTKRINKGVNVIEDLFKENKNENIN